MKRPKPIRIPNAGIQCERCGFTSELRRHVEITERLLNQPFYYSQWYQCTNIDCPRTTFMEDKDKIENPVGGTRGMRKRNERLEQTSFFKSL